MAVQLRQRSIRVLPFRLTLWAVVALVLVVAGIQQNPITLDGSWEESPGIDLTRDVDADILVVLDYEAIRQSGPTFEDSDFSAAWIDLIEQEVGPIAVATPETLSESMIDDSRVLIITHSITQDMPETLLEKAREHALGGHTLVVERPEGRAREIFSSDGDAGPRTAQSITHAEGMEEPFDQQLEEMPLFVDYIGSTAARDKMQTLLSIDGAPVIYASPFGDGHVITVDFDLGRQLVTLQQGRPNNDFSLPRNDSATSHLLRTSDLIASEEMVGAEVPYADLLTRFVVYGVLMRYAAVPVLWGYPDRADGVVTFVHEDADLGDRGAWKLEYENQHGGASTLVTTSDSGLSTEGAERIEGLGGQIGLAWRPPTPSLAHYEPVGIGGFEPMRRPIDLSSQREQLADILPVGNVRTTRSLHGTWSDHWSRPLETLAEEGVRADVSYESSTHRGYSFGSGLPFRPVNEKGVPLNLRQYPILVSATADEGPRVEELLEGSAGGHHQMITIATRPSMFADYPNMDDFQDWLNIFEHVKEYNHALLNLSSFAQFRYARRSSLLRSRVDHRAAIPERIRSSETAPSHTGTLLRITARMERRGLSLLIPARIGDAAYFDGLEGTERVGAEIVTNRVDTEEISMSGFSMYRIRLTRGFNNLELYYH